MDVGSPTCCVDSAHSLQALPWSIVLSWGAQSELWASLEEGPGTEVHAGPEVRLGPFGWGICGRQGMIAKYRV